MADLDDLVLSMSAALQAAESTMRDINDWGEPTGFCQEFDRLYQDADQQMRSLRSRAMHLRERIIKAKQASHDVAESEA